MKNQNNDLEEITDIRETGAEYIAKKLVSLSDSTCELQDRITQKLDMIIFLNEDEEEVEIKAKRLLSPLFVEYRDLIESIERNITYINGVLDRLDI